MAAEILGRRLAAAIAEETGHRFVGANHDRATEDVAGGAAARAAARFVEWHANSLMLTGLFTIACDNAVMTKRIQSSTMAIANTFAFSGIEAVPVEVQVQIAPGAPGLVLVGLPDKA